MEVARSRPGKLVEGSRLGDTYEIVRLVGEGGMGEVYEVRHARLAGRYALKIIRKDIIALTTMAIRRFQREAQVTSSLRHPNIVQIIDFNEAPDGSPFFVMEFLEGMDLEVRMRQRGPMPTAEALPIIEQIASALAAAHEHGVVHRDLKPQNVLLVPIQVPLHGQPSEFVKVVDFGISKVKTAESLTGTPVVMGTPHYMAPEQARGSGDEIDGRGDQFALAAMTYEMLCGRHAFPGDSVAAVIYNVLNEMPPSIAAVVGESVDTVLRTALAKQAQDRYPSVAAFAAALRSASSASARSIAPALVNAPARTYEAGPMAAHAPDKHPAAPAGNPRRKRVLVALAAGLALGGVAGLFVMRARPNRDERARQIASVAEHTSGNVQRALAAEHAPVASAAQSAVAVPELLNAVTSQIDAFTFNDLFETEEWWEPYRRFSVAVFRAERLVTRRGLADVAEPSTLRFWNTTDGRVANTVLCGSEDAYLAAGMPFSAGKPGGPTAAANGTGAGDRRAARQEPGTADASARFGLVLAKKIDVPLLDGIAEASGARAAVLTCHGRVVVGSRDTRASVTEEELAALPAPTAGHSVAFALLANDRLAVATAIGPGASIWTIRDNTARASKSDDSSSNAAR